jgi:hypothetical protein
MAKPGPALVADRGHRIDVELCIQPLLVGGQTVTAWRESEAGNSRLLTISVAHSWPKATARDEAIATVKRVSSVRLAQLLESHRRWWHDFYPASFVSLPDKRLQSFYWIQMYKFASATRAERAMIDNHGPWLEETAWPYATWDLNVQLTCWAMNGANRLSLGESLWRTLERNRQQLIDNVPEEYRQDSASIGCATTLDCNGRVGVPGSKERWQWNSPQMGNLLWAMHNVWLHYRHSGG